MRSAIELFGSEWCPPCGKAKEIIQATDPAAKGVEFKYIDVGEDPGYAMKTLPVVFIGDQKLEGPTGQQLKAALESLYTSIAPKVPSPAEESQEPSSDTTSQGLLVFSIFACAGIVAYSVFSKY